MKEALKDSNEREEAYFRLGLSIDFLVQGARAHSVFPVPIVCWSKEENRG